MAVSHSFEERSYSIFAAEIGKLVNEIAWIDARLLELDDSEEAEAERRLLMILRRHLVRDLYELAGFVWESESVEAEEAIVLSAALKSAVEVES